MFIYDDQENVIGLNHQHGLLAFGQSKGNLINLFIGMITLLDYDLTRGQPCQHDEDRATQGRLAGLLSALASQ